jgi:hypothetical protein
VIVSLCLKLSGIQEDEKHLRFGSRRRNVVKRAVNKRCLSDPTVPGDKYGTLIASE